MGTIPNALPSQAYRPPQWNKPAMVSITVPPQSSNSQGASTNGAFTVNSNVTAQTTYVFDAVLDLEHEQRLTKTRHPIQTGADISSHAYLEPASVAMFVGMSDAMDSYSSTSQTQPPYVQAWTGNPSKSVSAYQQMLTLQASRVPLTITTRLRTYQNMTIDSIRPHEDSKTITGLRMRIEFSEIRTGSVDTNPVTTLPNDTNSTGLGSVSVAPPAQPVPDQYAVPPSNTQGFDQPTTNLYNWLVANPQGVDVPGAGNWSSTQVNNLQQIPAPQ